LWHDWATLPGLAVALGDVSPELLVTYVDRSGPGGVLQKRNPSTSILYISNFIGSVFNG
jgi:hypothetical protein